MENKVLTELYSELFGLKDFFNIEQGLKRGELISAIAVSGENYEQSKFRLMYVGRALNGWGSLNGNNVEELVRSVLNEKGVKEFLCNAVYDPRHYEDYNINRSRFWQLCRKILEKAGEDETWAENIVWSNVYKVTYNGISISWSLMNYIYEACLKILKYELEFFRPNHVVFVTGTNYFLPKDLGNSFEAIFSLEHDPLTFEVVSKGIYTCQSGHKIKIVAVNRPECRKGTNEEKADKIMKAFNSIIID